MRSGPPGLQLLDRLGEGGMGEVARVLRREGAFARRYALKRLRRELARDPAARRAFLEEAALSGHLYHPNVVRVYEVGEDAEGPWMRMELVEGPSLAKIIQTLDAAGDTQPGVTVPLS